MRNYALARKSFFASVFISLITLIASTGQLPAAITPTGNVEPSGTWTTSTVGYIGHSTDGTLAVDTGSLLNSSTAYIANDSGVNGLATITGSGTKWTNSYSLYIGNYGFGTLSIEAGGQVSNGYSYLGYKSGSTGTATVSGVGSKWTNSSTLYLGYFNSSSSENSSSGVLTIEAGGQVSTTDCFLGFYGTGTATVTGTGSKWTNSSTLYIGTWSSGVLTIEAGGLVSSSGGVLGYNTASKGTATVTGVGSMWAISSGLTIGDTGRGTLTIAAGGQVSSHGGYLGDTMATTGTATVTGVGSLWNNSSVLYVGLRGTGSLTIDAGGQVSNGNCYLGCNGSAGAVTVTGAGSMWTNSSSLYVGYNGSGALTISAGGEVSNTDGYLGSTGTAIVTGAGSKWYNSSNLYFQNRGSTLHIRDGGMTTANSVYTYNSSLLTIDAGYDSVLNVNNGAGTITNDGKIRLFAGPQPTDGSQYSPIAAGTWSGSGTYQAVGGTWDTTSNVFTVSQVLNGVSGTPVGVDLAQQQRVLIGESSLNRTVGASFLAMTGTDKTFNLTAIALADVPALGGLLQPWESVFNAWTFTAEGAGYRATDPVYLSFSVPANMSRDKVRLWKLTGDTWSAFSADDLTVTGGYASFTSTGLSGYAVTVPEPAALVLVFTAIMGGLFVWRRRR